MSYRKRGRRAESAAALVADTDPEAAADKRMPHPGGATRKGDNDTVASAPTWHNHIEADLDNKVIQDRQMTVPEAEFRILLLGGGMGKDHRVRKKNNAAGTATRLDISPSSARTPGGTGGHREVALNIALTNMEAAPATTGAGLIDMGGTPPWCVNRSSTISITWSRPLARITVRSPFLMMRHRPATMDKAATPANALAKPHTQALNKTWATPTV